MPFDPALPQEHTPLDAAQMRAQLTGLKDLIDALHSITTAQVDAVTTLPPGNPANVTLQVTGSTLHFTFDLPQGATGADGSPGPQGASGSDGMNGSDGINGSDGAPGEPGEVTLQQLNAAIQTTSANSNSVATLGLTVSDPPVQSEVQQLADKLDELINALRR